jgi:hypothetical protein
MSVVRGFWDGLTGTDPRRFGNSTGAILLTAAGVGARFAGVGASAARLPLYRVVEPNELSDIKSTGAFRPSPTGAEGKSFWGSFGDAQSYQAQIEGKPGFGSPLTIVRTSASPSVAGEPIPMDRMDAYHIPNGSLGSLSPPEVVR